MEIKMKTSVVINKWASKILCNSVVGSDGYLSLENDAYENGEYDFYFATLGEYDQPYIWYGVKFIETEFDRDDVTFMVDAYTGRAPHIFCIDWADLDYDTLYTKLSDAINGTVFDNEGYEPDVILVETDDD